MATITRTLSKKINSSGKAEILLRVSVTGNTKLRIKSGVFVDVSRFRNGALIAPRSGQQAHEEYNIASKLLRDVENAIIDYCNTYRDEATKEGAQRAIDNNTNPEKISNNYFVLDVYEKFLDFQRDKTQNISLWIWVKHKLEVFQAYSMEVTRHKQALTLSDFTEEVLQRFNRFLANEVEISQKFPQLKKIYVRPIRGCSNNSITCLYERLNTFFKWCVKKNLISGNPLENIKLPKGKYGTPYYLTIEERNKIAGTDLKDDYLNHIRDIFVLQCLIGCRVSDLMRLTASNVVDGAIEYVPKKTRNHDTKVVRVPLNNRAMEILSKYASNETSAFLNISVAEYNLRLKQIFTYCGITRLVTVFNSSSGLEEQRPLNELASSHLARRTFIGNLYKKVKDPELIGAMSGHAVGSKAFARYRTIDEDIKKELVELIN